MQNLYKDLIATLQQDKRFVSDGNLLKNKVIECALNLDAALLKLLLGNDTIKQHFFQQLEGVFVFDKDKFQKFVSNKQFLPDSYTAFKNKIGLTVGDDFISDMQDVVLSWPYKDCVLEGGQTKEDQKRSEIFWNETLAPDEIDRLLSPKVFTNFKRYDKDGEHDVNSFSENDNLIIKGNNLLALCSLKKQYAGKVKLIYIDPPYYFNKNKPSDNFNYNTNFKLSSWLTFMKDRIIVSKELLSINGVFMCHVNEDCVHWLKVLMEEIYGTNNFVETFIWKNTDNPDSLSKKSRSSVEYIVCYEKNKNAALAYIGKETENGDAPLLNTGNVIHELSFPKRAIHFNIPDRTYKKGKYGRIEVLSDIIVKRGLNSNPVQLKGEFKWSQKMLEDEIKKGTYFIVKSKNFSIRFQRLVAVSMAPEKFIDTQYLTKAIGVGTNEDASAHLNNMGLSFPFSKPESVIEFFIRAVTKEHDLVLDFFVGSGTTAAVAHKMNRRYIGIEQLDYIKTITVERLKKVIAGEQGCISQSVNWQGGGSFVYFELAEQNQKFVEEIENITKKEEIVDIWKKIQNTNSLSYLIEPSLIRVDDDSFTKLTLDEQKRFLMECLEKNMLYIPYSEINDSDNTISDGDKKLNNQFYGKPE